jgi:hypothetical protein
VRHGDQSPVAVPRGTFHPGGLFIRVSRCYLLPPFGLERRTNVKNRIALLAVGWLTLKVQCNLLMTERVLFSPQFEQERWHLVENNSCTTHYGMTARTK